MFSIQKDLHFVSRIFVPYGPDIWSDNEPQNVTDRPFRWIRIWNGTYA